MIEKSLCVTKARDPENQTEQILRDFGKNSNMMCSLQRNLHFALKCSCVRFSTRQYPFVYFHKTLHKYTVTPTLPSFSNSKLIPCFSKCAESIFVYVKYCSFKASTSSDYQWCYSACCQYIYLDSQSTRKQRVCSGEVKLRAPTT